MTIPPIRRQLVVPVGPNEAFDAFTSEIGTWWPLDHHGVGGPGGSVAFDGHELVETSAEGDTFVWATVLEWVPGERLVLSWFPGGTPERATEVRVHFESIDNAAAGTSALVTLEHLGWENTADPTGDRGEYERGWPGVLRRFGEATLVGLPHDESWLVLRHTAGPAAPERGPIFAHPDFAEHAAFLDRLTAAGVLVAAGPLAIGDQPGAHGMTVIKVPNDEVQDYVRRAENEDQSVVRGLLDVEVTTWQVLMSSG